MTTCTGPWWRGAILLAMLAPLTGCGSLVVLEEALLGPTEAWTSPTAPGAYRDAASPPHRGPSAGTDAAEDEAWRLLTTRQVRPAQALFTAVIEKRPGDGRPIAGFSLAAAVGGDLEGAPATMRWALQTDPSALARVPVSPALRRRLRELVTCYRAQPGGPGERDALLMLAVVHHLLGERDAARSAARANWRLGDRSNASANLRRLVDLQAPSEASRPPAAPPPPGASAGVQAARAPSPSAPGVPSEPPDYDQLRADLLKVSDTLDRFTRKLLERLQETPPADPP